MTYHHYLHKFIEIIITESTLNLHGHHAAHVTVFLLLLFALLLALVAEGVTQRLGYCRVVERQNRLHLNRQKVIFTCDSAVV